MNCEECQIELEDLLYGELDPARATPLHAHLTACAECRAAQASLEREAEIFASYYEQTAAEPGEEMWEAIRARIHEGPQAAPRAGLFEHLSEWLSTGLFGSRLTPAMLRQAAFAVLLVTLSVGATVLYFKFKDASGSQVAVANPTPTPSATPSATPRPAPPVATPRINEALKSQLAEKRIQPAPVAPATSKRNEPRLQSESEIINAQVARAVREYQGAVKLLARAVEKRKSELDPNAVAQYESSLALIDESIAASRRALNENPTDPTAARFLLAAYSKKVELMQEIAMR